MRANQQVPNLSLEMNRTQNLARGADHLGILSRVAGPQPGKNKNPRAQKRPRAFLTQRDRLRAKYKSFSLSSQCEFLAFSPGCASALERPHRAAPTGSVNARRADLTPSPFPRREGERLAMLFQPQNHTDIHRKLLWKSMCLSGKLNRPLSGSSRGPDVSWSGSGYRTQIRR
jgi:hypothetical protein